MDHCCTSTLKQAAAKLEAKETSSALTVVIVGGGSAAHSAAIKASSLGAQCIIVNSGLPQGGCCVNVGCVPSKFLVRAAESVHLARAPVRYDGIEQKGDRKVKDFGALIAQKQKLVDSLRQSKVRGLARSSLFFWVS